VDRPLPWLRYVDASDLDDTAVDFDGMDVQSAAGDKLGDVDGFIVDSDTGRPYYIVVDSGGWFRSKHYLVPVGHATFEPSRHVFVAELTRENIGRFPGFDKDTFEKLSDEQLERLDLDIASACCPSEAVSKGAWADRWKHYNEPSWWKSNYYRPDRAGSAGVTAGAEWRNREATKPGGTATAHDKTSSR